MQHSPLPDGPRRTPAEEAVFSEGLSASGLLYAHRATIVFRLTTWPAGYPEQYDLSGGANEAEYEDRGWCFSEMCSSALTKPALNSLDLGKFSGTRLRLHGSNGIIAECTQGVRRPPLLPEQFLSELASKTFYNPTSDMPLVSMLYSQVFGEQMGAARELDFKRMGWGCAEATQLARVVSSGALPNLHRLNLSWNDVSDKGAKKLAEALKLALPPLEKLLYKGNPMGEGGAALLRAAGLLNLSADLGVTGMGFLPLERIIQAEPDLLVVAARPEGRPSLAHQALRHPAYAAVNRAQRIELPAGLWTCGGPQAADAVEILARAAHDWRRATDTGLKP